jgi:putative DNA primase/helicase
MFKALTGGDVVSAEYKFRDSFEYAPFCKLLFSANKPPQSDDPTHGFFRRWQVVPFTRCFEEGATSTLRREDIDAKLSQPNELSGVLNKALRALGTVHTGVFSQSDSMREAWEEFRNATDPLAGWLDQATIQLPTAMVPQGDLMAMFNRHLIDSGRSPVTKTAFGLALKRARPHITVSQRTLRGRIQWVYQGIGLTATEGGEN